MLNKFLTKKPMHLLARLTSTSSQFRNTPTQTLESHLSNKERSLFALLQNVQQKHFPTTTLRIAGGWVRDKLLGLESNDIDVTLDNISGEEFAQKVKLEYQRKQHKREQRVTIIKSNPEKSKHLETATMKINGIDIDFVNLRSEEYTDTTSRIPTMEEFGTPEIDAARRDLTMNALFYNLRNKSVEDLTQFGLDDLNNKILRTPPGRSPIAVLLEDPLRAMRIVRFAVKYNFQIENELWNALQNKDVHKALKLKVSPERVVTELDKMILASFNHSHLSIIEHATMMDSVDGSVDNGETKQLIKPEIILSKLGLHKAIFNRDDCNWNDTTKNATNVISDINKFRLNHIQLNQMRSKHNHHHHHNNNTHRQTEIQHKQQKQQEQVFLMSFYASILRHLLTFEKNEKQQNATNAIISQYDTESIAPLKPIDTVELQHVERCLNLRKYIQTEHKLISKFVDAIIVRHIKNSKKIAKRVTHVLLGLRLLETFSKYEVEHHADWMWTWLMHMDSDDTIHVISILASVADDDGSNGKKNKQMIITLKETLKEIENTKWYDGKKTNSILTGNDIMTEFPQCLGRNMQNTIFAHKLWYAMRMRKNKMSKAPKNVSITKNNNEANDMDAMDTMGEQERLDRGNKKNNQNNNTDILDGLDENPLQKIIRLSRMITNIQNTNHELLKTEGMIWLRDVYVPTLETK